MSCQENCNPVNLGDGLTLMVELSGCGYADLAGMIEWELDRIIKFDVTEKFLNPEIIAIVEQERVRRNSQIPNDEGLGPINP